MTHVNVLKIEIVHWKLCQINS